jgi:hypothetical protein
LDPELPDLTTATEDKTPQLSPRTAGDGESQRGTGVGYLKETSIEFGYFWVSSSLLGLEKSIADIGTIYLVVYSTVYFSLQHRHITSSFFGRHF